MTYREFVCDLAAVNDVGFAEYMSGHRYPAHLRRLLAFQHANRPGVSGALLPRDHAKTTAAIHLVARLIGERQGQVGSCFPDRTAVRKKCAAW